MSNPRFQNLLQTGLQFLRFNAVGIATIAIGTTVFALLIYTGLNYVLALLGDYIVGGLFSYFANKHFTFQVEVASDTAGLIKTALNYMVTFALNVLILWVAVDIYELDIVLSQIGAIVVLALLNFAVFKWIIFREPKIGSQHQGS